MNFGPETTEEDSFAIMDRALELGTQLFRHGERLRVEDWRGMDRTDCRPLVCAGRRPTGEGRARDQGIRSHGRLAECIAALGVAHQACLRSEFAASSDGLHRSVPDASCRPRDALGRNLAGHGAVGAGRQDPLRRHQQFCRVAAGAGAGTRPQPSFPRHRLGAKSLQSDREDDRTRSHSRL